MKIVINGKEVAIPSGGGSSEVYSTEETRIGTWVDGAPIYRRVLLDIPITSTNTWVTLIIVPDIRDVVDVRGAVRNAFDQDIIVPGINVDFQLSADNEIQVWAMPATSAWGNFKLKFVSIEYTKTTDQPAN